MSDDEMLDELLVRWEDEYKKGRDLSPQELCSDSPHLAERAQEIAKLKRMQPEVSTGPMHTPTPPSGAPAPPVQAFAGLRFEPQRHHASGGLGDVFVAVDAEVGREVALKRIKPRFADEPDTRARFEREAEITGRLEHPGVVPLYGKGQDADGRPYYAMRFIRGRSLRSAVEEYYKPENAKKDPGGRAVAFRGLLQSFTAACNTVAYAHSRGVIHRDLKPENIMLGPYGETLVVDWGLAKHVGRDEPHRDTAEQSVRPTPTANGEGTQPGAAVGTPAYMSSEQALGRPDVGPASDVFSLGATLYHLLTGRPPYQGTMALVDAAAGTFPRPRQVRRDVPRALDAVCLKAMAFRPEDRYATAKDLARDVDRWLADEPTAAYREPWRVRAWRWVKRHRTPVSATTAATVAVLVLGSLLLWAFLSQRRELAQETTAELAAVRDLREQGRFAEAKAAMARVEKLLSRGDPAGLADRVGQARKDLDMAAELDETPLVGAQQVDQEVGFDYEAVVRRYGELFRGYDIDVATMGSAEAASRIRASDLQEHLIVALDYWASLGPVQAEERGRLLETAGRADGDEGRKALRVAWAQADQQALERQLEGRDLSSLPPTTAVAFASALRRTGSLYRAKQVLRAVQQVHPNDFLVNYSLYLVLIEDYDHSEALEFLRAAVAVKADSSLAHNGLGFQLARLGRRDEAEKEYRRALQIKDSAEGHNGLGSVLKGAGRPEEAEKEYRQAIQIKDDFDLAHHNLGNMLKDLGRREEAEKEYRRAIQIDVEFAQAHNNLGILLVDARRREEAEKEFRRAIQIKDEFAVAHNNLANLLAVAGRREEAEKEYRRALQINYSYAEAENNLGILLEDQGRFGEAMWHFEQALEHSGLQASASFRGSVQKNLDECRVLKELDEKLPAILKGDIQPKASEKVAYAHILLDKGGYATAARLYQEAFAEQPALANDLNADNRYYAACAAALAAAGKGEGGDKLDYTDRLYLRRQALDWLRSDLTMWGQVVEIAPPQAQATVKQILQHWRDYSELAGVRDVAALDMLPDPDRVDWKKLWADVDALLAKMDPSKKP